MLSGYKGHLQDKVCLPLDPSRVRRHISVCFLAFLLIVTLQRRLSEIGVKQSVWKAIRDVSKVKAVTLYIND